FTTTYVFLLIPIVSRVTEMLRLCSFFFFESYRDHRDLHSFPTRRSSDLTSSRISTPTITGRRCSRSSTPRSRGGRSRWRPSRRRDRKSTRLNSSHVKISYAVFCLKKKN